MSEIDYLGAQRKIEAELHGGWTGWTEAQLQYLNDHVWAVLATSKEDGSPQVSMIGYVLDPDDSSILISAKAYTAKSKNAARRPKVALVVHDDRKQLVVYGAAEVVTADPRRAELSAKLFGRVFNAPVSSDLPNSEARRRTAHPHSHHADVSLLAGLSAGFTETTER